MWRGVVRAIPATPSLAPAAAPREAYPSSDSVTAGST